MQDMIGTPPMAQNPAGTAQLSAGGRKAAQRAGGAGSAGLSLVEPQRSSAVLKAQQQWLPAIRGMAVQVTVTEVSAEGTQGCHAGLSICFCASH